MKVYRLHRRQHLPISPEQSWTFFSNPRNLEQITPPELGISITSEIPERMVEGMIITYRLRLPPGNHVDWITEIKHVDPPHCFIDEQRAGPYRFWYHEHRFMPVGDGVETEDTVHYAPPFGVLGRAAHALFVRRQLNRIFDYRQDYLQGLFAAPA